MSDYTDEYSFDKLFKIFRKYTHIGNEKLLLIPGITEENVEKFSNNIEIMFLTDDQLFTIEKIISNIMNPVTFSHEVPDDEEDYCWHIGRVLLRRCHAEITRRNLSNITRKRTNNN